MTEEIMERTVIKILTTSLVTLFFACVNTSNAPQDGKGGPECGPGTSDINGECIANAICGAGTNLVEGRCIVDATPCPPNSTLVDGVCVRPLICANGTEELNGECVAVAECGRGTIVQNGACVSESYGPPNVLFITEQISQALCRGLIRCCADAPGFENEIATQSEKSCETYLIATLGPGFDTLDYEFYDLYEPRPYGTDTVAMETFLNNLEADSSCNMSLVALGEISGPSFGDALLHRFLSNISPLGGVCFEASTDAPLTEPPACAEDLYCAAFPPEVENPVSSLGCFEKMGSGGACDYTIQCQSGLHCSANICNKNPGLEKSCSAVIPCADGLFCDTDTCRALRKTGQACTENDTCEAGLVCISGSCANVAQLGENCGGGSADSSTHCATDARCASPENICIAYVSEGGICESGDACFPGSDCLDQDTEDADTNLRCYSRTNICVAF